MSFTPNIPASGQTLGNSRLQVLNNFASLRTTISNVTQPNHIDVNNSGAGKHIFVQMPNQTPGAANLPAAGEGGLITRAILGNSELYYVRDAVNTYYQMTGPFVMNVGPPANGSVLLFGGLIMKWGLLQNTAGPFNFVTPFPNNCFGVTFTPISGNQRSFAVLSFNVTQFDVTISGGPVNQAFYIALGN
jgi:hypothetical protein